MKLLICLLLFFLYESSMNRMFNINTTVAVVEQDTTVPNREDVFIILTSTRDTTLEFKGGILKMENWDSTYMDSPSTHYSCFTLTEKTYISFSHVDYNLEAINKIRPVVPRDKMKTCTVPKDFLSTVELVDFDKLICKMTEHEVYDFQERVSGKRTWVIDRNDITRDSVKLVEVWVHVPHGF